MIEVLFRDTGPAVIVGEAEDLEGISLLRLNQENGEVTLEDEKADRKSLGTLTKAAVDGLANADEIIVAGLFKNTLAWARAVDVNEFQKPPRKVTEIEITALIKGMNDSGYFGESAEPPKDKKTRTRDKKRQRR